MAHALTLACPTRLLLDLANNDTACKPDTVVMTANRQKVLNTMYQNTQ